MALLIFGATPLTFQSRQPSYRVRTCVMKTGDFCDHVFIRRLSELHELSVTDQRAVLDIVGPPKKVAKGQDIVVDGSALTSVPIIVSGAACRYKVLSGGQRQILGFLLPGDMAEDFGGGSTVIDHGVSASTACVVENIPRNSFHQIVGTFPNVARAVWQYCLIQGSLYRSWLVNMRRRSAPERLAHLLCEQFVRLQAVGLAKHGEPIPLHIVQSDLADATGMSVIHLNRTLQHLRSRNLIGRNHGKLEILEWDRLKELAEFDPIYLQSRRPNQPSSPIPSDRERDSAPAECGAMV
jgi:CRP-like cAMP-binding protein